MASPKVNDIIILMGGGVQVPAPKWKFGELDKAAMEAQRLFTGTALTLVPLKAPTSILWKIEKSHRQPVGGG